MQANKVGTFGTQLKIKKPPRPLHNTTYYSPFTLSSGFCRIDWLRNCRTVELSGSGFEVVVELIIVELSKGKSLIVKRSGFGVRSSRFWKLSNWGTRELLNWWIFESMNWKPKCSRFGVLGSKFLVLHHLPLTIYHLLILVLNTINHHLLLTTHTSFWVSRIGELINWLIVTAIPRIGRSPPPEG